MARSFYSKIGSKSGSFRQPGGDADSSAALAGQLPYEALVDTARGGASQFGGLRSMSEDEKLEDKIGNLQSFFGRIAAIGTPPQEQGQLKELIQEGLMRRERAKQGPEREAIGSMMQQAAARRAQMETEAHQKAQEAQDFSRNLEGTRAFAALAPSLDFEREEPLPPGVQGPPGIQGIPSSMIQQAMRTGDSSQLAPWIRPGAGDERRQQAEQQRQLAVLREQQGGQENLERMRQAGADRRHKQPQDKGGNITLPEVRAELADLTKATAGDPHAELAAIKSFQDANGGLDIDADAAGFLETRVAVLMDAIKRAGGAAAGGLVGGDVQNFFTPRTTQNQAGPR